MAEKTNTGLVAYARAQLGRPYWFGTFGQKATQALYTYNKSRLPGYYTAADFPKQYGQRVHDCAGLIKGYLWSDGPEAAPNYCSGGVPDISADQMKASCTELGGMSNLPEIPGVLVFAPQHVGVYIGNGEVIEARGHAYGVVQTKVKERSWTSWGKLKYITYEEDNSMEYLGSGTVKLYINTKKKTLAQIQAETGCKAVINGGLFDMSKFKAVAQLKADGTVYANENWGTNYGMAWGKGALRLAHDVSADDNFIGCIGLVENGKAVKPLNYPADMGGARQRTAFGVMPDGRIWLYAIAAGRTPETLQQLALDKGVKDAIMLDGGASTQCIMPAGKLTGSRIVHNVICLYEEKAQTTQPETPMLKNSYTAPSSVPVTLSSTNTKWLQTALKNAGYKGKDGKVLTVDGQAGTNTAYALANFLKDKLK